ncbi:MAG TPA: N-methyl-L-tryptophan oxidase [Solirubrobacteraceae bacterium]|nr:N-methyl-L-tryptophan oxidase [Solirubrobacteraceae bacterium]
MRTSDVIVVGLGAMGSAACRALAARGASVVGIDRYAPPHPLGSTHGDTRITRLAIGEGREYVPLVRRSHRLWREIERQTGTRLLTQAGVLVLAPAASPFLAETLGAAATHAIPHERLTHAEIGARFPMFQVREDTVGYHEPEGGYVRPEAAVAAQLDLARRHGAQLRLGERVDRWRAGAGGVTVTTDAGSYAAGRLLLCAGAWVTELFPEGRDMFAVYRQLMYWWPIDRGYEQLRDMPAFVCDLGGVQDGFVHLDGFYGFPAVDGPAGGVKLAAESFEAPSGPDGRQHPPTGSEIERIARGYVAPYLPWLGTQPLRAASCLYTSTRGCRFVIDRHPGHESVLIVSACSGHGFKHSPAIGEAVAQWLTEDEPDIDLSPFSFDRARRAAGG